MYFILAGQLQWETKRSRIDDTSYPQKTKSDQGYVLDEQYSLDPFGRDVPPCPIIVSQADNIIAT